MEMVVLWMERVLGAEGLDGSSGWKLSHEVSHWRMISKWVSEPGSGSLGKPSWRGATGLRSASSVMLTCTLGIV